MQLAPSTKYTKAFAILLSIAFWYGLYTWWTEPKSVETKDPVAELRVRAITYGQIALEQRLRDPSSVKYDFKAINLDNGALCYSYSAKNGFGGMSQERTSIVEGKFAGFDKHCPKGANYERY